MLGLLEERDSFEYMPLSSELFIAPLVTHSSAIAVAEAMLYCNSRSILISELPDLRGAPCDLP